MGPRSATGKDLYSLSINGNTMMIIVSALPKSQDYGSSKGNVSANYTLLNKLKAFFPSRVYTKVKDTQVEGHIPLFKAA